MPGGGIGHAGNGEVDAGQQRIRILRISGGSIGGHHVRAHDGCIEGHLALRDMAVGALRVIRLESAGVVDAGGEIDIVVAGSASRPARLRQKAWLARRRWFGCGKLRNAGHGGIDHRGKIVDGIHVADQSA